mgnify:CR=1 FL=1
MKLNKADIRFGIAFLLILVCLILAALGGGLSLHDAILAGTFLTFATMCVGFLLAAIFG